MAVTLKPLSDTLGVELVGLDLTRPIAEADAAVARQALLDHHLVMVHQEDLTDHEHLNFCLVFGELQGERTVPDDESEEIPGMMHVSNVRDDGILRDGDMWLHYDQCYFDTPCKCTSLYGIATPKSGGHTRFSDCTAVYEDLPQHTKDRLAGLKGMNYYDYYTANAQKKVEDWAPDTPHFAHPIIRTHPETGRKSVYVNRLMTEYVLDIDDGESREILDDLFDRIEDERYIYTHPWKPGDLVIWDNRCLAHGRTDFDPAEPRILRRFAVKGEQPF